jgi:hypothetical protein
MYRLEHFPTLVWASAYISPVVFLLKTTITVQYKIKKLSLLIIIFIFLLAFLFYLFSNQDTDSVPYYLMHFVRPFVFYYSIIYILGFLQIDKIIRDLKWLIDIFIFYLIFEVSLRIYNVFNSKDIITSFYSLKNSGGGGTIFYPDTNFLGLIILYIIALLIFLHSYTKDNSWLKKVYFLYFFVILTLSRSAIITAGFLLYINNLLEDVRKKQYILFLIKIVVALIVFFIGFSIINNDASFSTKTKTIERLVMFFDKPLNNQLFGFGITDGLYAYSYKDGKYAHLHIALILGQFGLFGLFLYITLFSVFFIQSNGKNFFLIIGLLVSGFSLAYLDASFYYVFAVITVLSQRKYIKDLPKVSFL